MVSPFGATTDMGWYGKKTSVMGFLYRTQWVCVNGVARAKAAHITRVPSVYRCVGNAIARAGCAHAHAQPHPSKSHAWGVS